MVFKLLLNEAIKKGAVELYTPKERLLKWSILRETK